MKTRNALATLLTASALAALTFAAASPASAQCRRGGIFCAQVHVGVGFSGGIVIGAPPPPPVIVAAPPPPPVVVYEAAPPPPVVVYQQQPQQVVAVARTPLVYQERPMLGWGIHGHMGGMLSDAVQMGGLTGAFRLRPNPHVGIDFGIGTYAGVDYNDNDRVEVPLTVDGLFFLNPQGVAQPYALIGVGVSFASVAGPHITGVSPGYATSDSQGYAYYGGELGAGLELRLSRHWAINGDIRVFLRQRAGDGSSTPEFVEQDAFGNPTGRTTNTSWGGLGTLGATLYF
jgi:hypothetical protein